MSGLIALWLMLAPPPHVRPPQYPVIIRTDQPAYSKTDKVRLTLANTGPQDVWIEPTLVVERSRGDGSWAHVYTLRAVAVCPAEPPPTLPCVRIGAGQSLALAAWDWNTGGYTQCPPRRPGHRAFKGVHRFIARWCQSRPLPERATARIKLVTWE